MYNIGNRSGFTEDDQYQLAQHLTNFSSQRTSRMGLGMMSKQSTEASRDAGANGDTDDGCTKDHRIGRDHDHPDHSTTKTISAESLREKMKQQLASVALQDADLHARKISKALGDGNSEKDGVEVSASQMHRYDVMASIRSEATTSVLNVFNRANKRGNDDRTDDSIRQRSLSCEDKKLLHRHDDNDDGDDEKPIYKVVKRGDVVLAKYPPAVATSPYYRATVKSAIHSGYPNAMYDIVYEGYEAQGAQSVSWQDLKVLKEKPKPPLQQAPLAIEKESDLESSAKKTKVYTVDEDPIRAARVASRLQMVYAMLRSNPEEGTQPEAVTSHATEAQEASSFAPTSAVSVEKVTVNSNNCVDSDSILKSRHVHVPPPPLPPRIIGNISNVGSSSSSSGNATSSGLAHAIISTTSRPVVAPVASLANQLSDTEFVNEDLRLAKRQKGSWRNKV